MTHYAYISTIDVRPIFSKEFEFLVPERADDDPWAVFIAPKKKNVKSYILNLDILDPNDKKAYNIIGVRATPLPLIRRLSACNHSVAYLVHLARDYLPTTKPNPKGKMRMTMDEFEASLPNLEEDVRYLIVNDPYS